MDLSPLQMAELRRQAEATVRARRMAQIQATYAAQRASLARTIAQAENNNRRLAALPPAERVRLLSQVRPALTRRRRSPVPAALPEEPGTPTVSASSGIFSCLNGFCRRIFTRRRSPVVTVEEPPLQLNQIERRVNNVTAALTGMPVQPYNSEGEIMAILGPAPRAMTVDEEIEAEALRAGILPAPRPMTVDEEIDAAFASAVGPKMGGRRRGRKSTKKQKKRSRKYRR